MTAAESAGEGAAMLICRLWDHAFWADDLLWRALTLGTAPPTAAWREYAHILGAEELWLSRLEERDSRTSIWPELSTSAASELRRSTRAGYEALLRQSRDSLDHSITYRNSDAKEFTNRVGDILVHVALHAQYHRGKVNLLLRQEGRAPSPVDFIAFVRGVPAAVTPLLPGNSPR